MSTNGTMSSHCVRCSTGAWCRYPALPPRSPLCRRNLLEGALRRGRTRGGVGDTAPRKRRPTAASLAALPPLFEQVLDLVELALGLAAAAGEAGDVDQDAQPDDGIGGDQEGNV